MFHSPAPHAYPIRIRRRKGNFELTIPELLLTVRAESLSKAYELLRGDQRALTAMAAAIGALDEMPPPSAPPPVGNPAARPQDLSSEIDTQVLPR
jgi:hypothetical protein